MYVKCNIDETIKTSIIQFVFKNSKEIYGFQKTLKLLEQSYCNIFKTILIDSKFIDVCKLKNKKETFYNEDIEILVTGIWFSSDSFGLYTDYNIIHKENTCLINNSDSDSENYLI
jgi:hypothetical protein